MASLSELTARRKAEEQRFDEKLEELKSGKEARQIIEKNKVEQAKKDLYQVSLLLN